MHKLLIVYRIDKDEGSEGGSGYHLASAIIARGGRFCLISRKDNIQKLKNDPTFCDVELIGIDVPRWLSFYKKGGRGIILYYYLWQICVGWHVRTLQKTRQLSVIHQINFHARWAPHFLFSTKARILWGPLTQHAFVPFELWDEGALAYGRELGRRMAKGFFRYCDPFVHWAARRSDVIFLGQKFRATNAKQVFLPQAASVFPVMAEKPINIPFVILFVGRFISLKGVVPAMQSAIAFARQYPDTIIRFIGDGPLRNRLDELAAQNPRLKIEIHPWMSQSELSRHYQQAAVFLFPSLEGQGMVVAEAMAHGCPVVCLENTGPCDVAGDAAVAVPMGKRSSIINALGQKLVRLATEESLYQAYVTAALGRAAQLSWTEKAKSVTTYYDD